jgi:hypothetical protein
MRLPTVTTTVLVAVLMTTAQLSAHDFWLAATTWSPGPDGKTTITAGVGEKFPTRTNFRSRDNWLAAWRVIGLNGDIPVTKDFRRDSLVVANDVTLPAPGAYLGVALVSAQTIEMKGQEFTDYLKEEGLDSVIAARQAAGEADKATRERYARYAKIAIRNGAGAGTHLTRPVGIAAEFVPAVDPTSLTAGQLLTVQLLTNGAPVRGATVSAVTDGAAVRRQTDSEGRATFPIDRAGAWLIKTVHMVRLPPGGEAEWESYWVTLAFHAAAR